MQINKKTQKIHDRSLLRFCPWMVKPCLIFIYLPALPLITMFNDISIAGAWGEFVDSFRTKYIKK